MDDAPSTLLVWGQSSALCNTQEPHTNGDLCALQVFRVQPRNFVEQKDRPLLLQNNICFALWYLTRPPPILLSSNSFSISRTVLSTVMEIILGPKFSPKVIETTKRRVKVGEFRPAFPTRWPPVRPKEIMCSRHDLSPVSTLLLLYQHLNSNLQLSAGDVQAPRSGAITFSRCQYTFL